MKKPIEKKPVKSSQIQVKSSALSQSTHVHSDNKHPNENLYVRINDITLKRKYLLESLKSSLILQEEREKIIHIRSEKIQLLNQIKKETDVINLKYQSLRKLLPNVKNIISYTEKELNELDSQVDMLKIDVKSKTREIAVDEKTRENLISGMGLRGTHKSRSSSEVKTVSKEPELKKPLTKLDRIQNNLKLIESKLKNI